MHNFQATARSTQGRLIPIIEIGGRNQKPGILVLLFHSVPDDCVHSGLLHKIQETIIPSFRPQEICQLKHMIYRHKAEVHNDVMWNALVVHGRESIEIVWPFTMHTPSIDQLPRWGLRVLTVSLPSPAQPLNSCIICEKKSTTISPASWLLSFLWTWRRFESLFDLVKYRFWSGEEIPGISRPVAICARTAYSITAT